MNSKKRSIYNLGQEKYLSITNFSIFLIIDVLKMKISSKFPHRAANIPVTEITFEIKRKIHCRLDKHLNPSPKYFSSYDFVSDCVRKQTKMLQSTILSLDSEVYLIYTSKKLISFVQKNSLDDSDPE